MAVSLPHTRSPGHQPEVIQMTHLSCSTTIFKSRRSYSGVVAAIGVLYQIVRVCVRLADGASAFGLFKCVVQLRAHALFPQVEEQGTVECIAAWDRISKVPFQDIVWRLGRRLCPMAVHITRPSGGGGIGPNKP